MFGRHKSLVLNVGGSSGYSDAQYEKNKQLRKTEIPGTEYGETEDWRAHWPRPSATKPAASGTLSD